MSILWSFGRSQFTFECTCNTQCITNPYLAKFMELSLYFLFVRSATQFLCCWFRKFDIESTNNSQIDIFLYSHCSSAWYCIDIVWRNYASITRSLRVKGLSSLNVVNIIDNVIQEVWMRRSLVACSFKTLKYSQNNWLPWETLPIEKHSWILWIK